MLVLNCPQFLRFSLNLCSNPLQPKEALNMGFTVVGFHGMYTALLPWDIIVIFILKMTHGHDKKTVLHGRNHLTFTILESLNISTGINFIVYVMLS